jgi:oxalate decarboxylase/phosphoglucose isomerase-like protein (cupin superfamily)
MLKRLLFGVLLGCVCVAAGGAPDAVDNDVVRIIKGVDMPHRQSALHRHVVNRVMIYLDGGDMTLVHDDGRREEQHWKPGQVAWSPAGGLHTSENVGSAPIHLVEIELKRPAPAAPTARKAELDPVGIDPEHNILLFENAQVRVFRSWREPGGTELMHEHAGTGRAAVLLTDLDASVKLPDGTASTVHGSAGDVMWSGPVTHSTTNLGSKKFEMIIVEVK